MKWRAHQTQALLSAMLLMASLGAYAIWLHLGDSGYSDLTQEDRQRLSAQRNLVLGKAQRRYGTSRFFADERDLAVLQKRIERAEAVDVTALFAETLGFFEGNEPDR